MFNAEEEHKLIKKAEERYGIVLINSLNFIDLLYEFIEEVKPDAFIFISFLTQTYNSLQLALFSILRRHNTQYNLMLRNALESALLAAYALKEKKIETYGTFLKDGRFESKKLSKTAGTWLENNYKYHSEKIKFMKNNINNTFVHSSIIQVGQVFNFEDIESEFKSTFFDRENLLLEKLGILNTGNIAMGFIQMFDIINKDFPSFKVKPTFNARYMILAKQHDEIRNKFKDDKRFNKILEG